MKESNVITGIGEHSVERGADEFTATNEGNFVVC